MTATSLFILLAIIAVLTGVVAILLWRNLRHQRDLRDKNDVIIREIRENAHLCEELCDSWRHATILALLCLTVNGALATGVNFSPSDIGKLMGSDGW